MTPQERLILIIAEVQWILDYWNWECDDPSNTIDWLELQDDIDKISVMLDNAIWLVHQTYTDKDKVNELLNALLTYVHNNYGETSNNSN